MPLTGWPFRGARRLHGFVLSSSWANVLHLLVARRMQTGFKQYVLSGGFGKGDAMERKERMQNLVGLLHPAAPSWR